MPPRRFLKNFIKELLTKSIATIVKKKQKKCVKNLATQSTIEKGN